jgi:microcystin-dependent protein
MGQGPGLASRVLGESGGTEQVTLNTNQIPAHTHPYVTISDQGNQTSPAGNLSAQSINVVPYINDAPGASFAAGAISPTGGSQPHENFQPYLCVNFILSAFGIFPSPT